MDSKYNIDNFLLKSEIYWIGDLLYSFLVGLIICYYRNNDIKEMLAYSSIGAIIISYGMFIFRTVFGKY